MEALSQLKDCWVETLLNSQPNTNKSDLSKKNSKPQTEQEINDSLEKTIASFESFHVKNYLPSGAASSVSSQQSDTNHFARSGSQVTKIYKSSEPQLNKNVSNLKKINPGEIKRGDLHVIEGKKGLLGEGAFGTVHIGKWHNSSCAVKKILVSARNQIRQDKLIDEARIQRYFNSFLLTDLNVRR